MIGNKLVEKFEELGLCKPKSLRGSDLDWLFIGEENEAAHNFFSWFCDNVSSYDVLSTEELEQFEELEDAGQMLQGSQLDAMAAYLGGLGSLVPAEQNPLLGAGDLSSIMPQLGDPAKQEEKVQKQLEKLDQQLERLNSRINQLRLQQLSVGAEVDELQKQQDAGYRDTAEQLKSAKCAAQELTDYLAKLSAGTQQLTEVLLSLTEQSETGQTLLVYSDLKAWQQEEQRCSEALENLASKLLSLDKENVASSSDTTLSSEEASTSSLGSLERTLPLRLTSDEQTSLSLELQRLHQLVQSSSKEDAAAEVTASRHKAELEEAGRALERVTRGHYNHATEQSLREEDQDLQTVVTALQQEAEQQQGVVDTLVERCADRHSTATLSADCAAKKLRQLYYSQQLQKVVSLELDQLARHDLVSITLQCEAEMVQQSLQLLQSSSSQLEMHHHAALFRLAKLEQLFERERASRFYVDSTELPSSVKVLAAMVGDGEREDKENVVKLSDAFAELSVTGAIGETFCSRRNEMQVVCDALKQLVEQLEDAEQDLGGVVKFQTLHKLWRKITLLEECLGASGGRLPPSLPPSWLAPPLAHAHADLDTSANDLKLDIMAFLKLYEQKKKVLSSQPDLESQLSSWTKPAASSDKS